jgi:hypothetical protein
MQPARPQAQRAEATSLKRPRPNTDAGETRTPKLSWQLELPYLAASCNKSHKCNELWVRERNFHNHFAQHLLPPSSKFRAQDGSNGWVCDPETCKETFADSPEFMAHIWKKHMRGVSRQQSGPSQPPIGALGYSQASYPIPHTPGDDPTFSPHPTVFSPSPSITPNAMTPNATVSNSSPFPTSSQAHFSMEPQTSVPFGMQPAGTFPSNWYPHTMHGNNNNMLHRMPHVNLPYGFNSPTVMSNNNVTHSNVGQNMARAFPQDSMTGWQDQSLSAMLSSNPAAGQPHPAYNDFVNNSNAGPHFG